jgi:hypothetical protein
MKALKENNLHFALELLKKNSATVGQFYSSL